MKNYLMPNSYTNSGVSIFDGFEELFKSIGNERGRLLATDVKEYPTHYLLEIEVPGISKNNIDLTVENGYLTVSSTKTDKNDGTVDDWKYIRRERAVSAVRSFYIGENDCEVKATYTDGMLYVHVQKCPVEDGSNAKKIEIH